MKIRSGTTYLGPVNTEWDWDWCYEDDEYCVVTRKMPGGRFHLSIKTRREVQDLLLCDAVSALHRQRSGRAGR